MKSIAEIFRSYGIVDESGRHVNGTDKQTNHCYGDAYESLFTIAKPEYDPGSTVKMYYPYSTRNDIRLVMEVGVSDGSSLLAWEKIFPNATIVGMDIHAASKIGWGQFKRNRIEFYLGDQRIKEDCDRAAAWRQFDMIVEDATHILENSLLTLLYLWPYVKPGGIYVIEEFANIGELRENVKALWPNVQIIDTTGPFGGIEPLVVFRKPI